MTSRALTGANVFDGTRLLPNHAVLLNADKPQIVPMGELPEGIDTTALAGGVLMPGFVDLQLNGGGGVMLGDAPNLEGVRRIAEAHHGLGSRAILPTLITDRAEITQAAIAAVAEAISEKTPGVIGLHLEGPHLDPLRQGAHDPALIRPMTDTDLDTLLRANDTLPNLLVTLAPEAASLSQIATLAQAGVIVSLGHSDCDYGTAMRAFDAGARCTTHLFNAMSQLGSRAPGLVGATLNNGTTAGLIADGIHVHPATIRTALKAQQSPGEIFLVSDAMATAGSDIDRFMLNGREIIRAKGRLTLADGTLAGADLSMAQALRVMIEDVGDTPEKALARATQIPAGLLRQPSDAGGWPEAIDGLIYLDDDYQVQPASALL